MQNRQLLAIEFVVALFAWAAIARVFVVPRLARLEPQRALRAIIAPQMLTSAPDSIRNFAIASFDFVEPIVVHSADISGAS